MKKIGGICRLAVIAAIALIVPVNHVHADFNVYGFAQLDYIQDFKRVDPDWQATLRPGKIPTTKGLFGSDGQAIVSARQSRLGVEGTIPAGQEEIYARFEFDLFGVGPDAGQFTMRVRHVYGEFGRVLAGQTNSVFMDADIIPDVLDYWGPAGVISLLNPQLRYSLGSGDGLKFAIAIEEPLNNIDIEREFAGTVPDEKLPDLTMQARKTMGKSHVQLSGIVRRVGYDTPATTDNKPNGSDTGWGVNLTSVLKPRPGDALKLGVVYGTGISNYIKDGGTDLAPYSASLAAGSVKAVPLLGVSAYYDIGWSERYTSTIGYSSTQVDNTSFQTGSAFHKGEYASTNFIVRPSKDMFYGIEYLWGRRSDNGGASGTDQRVQLSWRYKFVSNRNFVSR
jgi:hypothetical protein